MDGTTIRKGDRRRVHRERRRVSSAVAAEFSDVQARSSDADIGGNEHARAGDVKVRRH
jgi:hypothetical protein